jgi:hypothetical protein
LLCSGSIGPTGLGAEEMPLSSPYVRVDSSLMEVIGHRKEASGVKGSSAFIENVSKVVKKKCVSKPLRVRIVGRVQSWPVPL